MLVIFQQHGANNFHSAWSMTAIWQWINIKQSDFFKGFHSRRRFHKKSFPIAHSLVLSAFFKLPWICGNHTLQYPKGQAVHWVLFFHHKASKRQKQPPKCSVKKGVLRNFGKFTGKHLCQSLFFNKVAGFIKKETLTQVFSCEFCKTSKNTFSYRTPLVAASNCYKNRTISGIFWQFPVNLRNSGPQVFLGKLFWNIL